MKTLQENTEVKRLTPRDSLVQLRHKKQPAFKNAPIDYDTPNKPCKYTHISDVVK